MITDSPSGANPARESRGEREPGARTHPVGRSRPGAPSRSPWSRAEQETVLRWDEEEQIVHVYSASPVTWRKMLRLGVPPSKETFVKGALSGRFYRVPLAQFRWRLKSEAMAAARKGRKPGESSA